MKNLKTIIQECNLTFDEVTEKYSEIFTQIFEKEQTWICNIEDKTNRLKPKDKVAIDFVIGQIKDKKYLFTANDTTNLSVFISKINSIVKIGNRINNFKNGTLLDNNQKLILSDLFNYIKEIKDIKEFEFNLNKNLNVFVPHLFSIIKHCQYPDSYPIYYKFWRNILKNVLEEKDDYDSFCTYYKAFYTPKHLTMGAYFGTLGTLLAQKISENNIIVEEDDRMYKYIKENLLNIHYFDLITGYNKNQISNKEKFKKWLEANNTDGSNKVGSYIRSIEIISEIIKEDLFEVYDLQYLNDFYEDIIDEQKKEKGKYYYEEAPSYGKDGFYSAAVQAYISFLKTKDSVTSVSEPNILMKTKVKNELRQALCIIGASGAGKTYRVNETLKTEKHETLFVILDSMWQHLLVDYSPNERKYQLTKIGDFIKLAHENKDKFYTIVIDECHKNLEVVNDVLLQAISTKRNNGLRFLSLNSIVDPEFEFLPEQHGTRILPDNLGFIFISSKSDIIEGNDDLKNRIEIIELTKEDQETKDYTIDYLLRKVKKQETSDYSN